MKVAAAGPHLCSAIPLLCICIGWKDAAAETTTQTVVSRLQFPLPTALSRALGYEHEEALFGPHHPYGGVIAERVIHGGVQPGKAVRAWTLCSIEDAELVLPILPPDSSPFILMVDRGECTFVTKTRWAQKLGAVGVLFADDMCQCSDAASGICSMSGNLHCEEFGPTVGDDGSGADITIPSLMMQKMDATIVKNRLEKGVPVMAKMSWSLAAPDGGIE
ncbi:conserved unknown protein [Ectocarpus siliculosus]|uniref:PA domain-containing protein n=1 Tax=Ectocarpus siliculosus TaxID=2880 RepID=D8LR62_ECTSI|nr:conserved unknown protein [Ectocarpus siliculosus]|eukprot:CBN77735.1 conserved unknown protein [Ectocarpus siliculosus]